MVLKRKITVQIHPVSILFQEHCRQQHISPKILSYFLLGIRKVSLISDYEIKGISINRGKYAYIYMLTKLFEVKNTGNKGKGLFAKVPIPKGTIVSFECPKCLRISKDDFKFILTNNEKSLILRYAYRKADGSYLLPCDEIIYLNHSCNAKILGSEKGFDIVVKDIAKGEEATYDYRSFFFS